MLMRVESLYGLSFIKYVVIDVNQIHIQKPRKPFVGHYFFFFKSNFCNMKWQVLVDYYKKILEKNSRSFCWYVWLDEQCLHFVDFNIVPKGCEWGLISIFYYPSNMVLLMLIKYTFRNQEGMLLGITFFSNSKVYNMKWTILVRWRFKKFSLVCLAQWIMLTFYKFSSCIKRLWMGICFNWFEVVKKSNFGGQRFSFVVLINDFSQTH